MSAARKPRAAAVAARQPESGFNGAASALEPDRFSRVSWIAGILTERIIDGTYPVGERIREASLQEEFGCSNGPIREALQRLVADGLAVRSPWQGVRVIDLDERDITDLFELRGALLERAAALAARNSGPDTAVSADFLRKALASKFSEARAGRVPAVTGDTTDWVMTVAANPFITQVWRSTMLKSRIYVYRSMQKTAGAGTEPIINELIDSIVRGKPHAAKRAAAALTRQMLVDLDLPVSTNKEIHV